VKVCFLIDTLANGGAEKMLLRLLRADGWGKVEPETVYYMGRSHDLRPEFEKTGMNVVDLGHVPTSDARVLYRAVKDFRRNNIDVLHNHLPDSHIVGRIAGRLAGVDKIVSTHHSVSNTPAYQSLSGTLERLTRSMDSASIAVSKSVRDSLMSTENHNWKIIHNSINVSEFSSAVAQADTSILRKQHELSGGPIFLNIGRYVAEKGQSNLIAAMEKVVESEPDAKLLIVGWGTLKARLEREIENRGLEHSVYLTGPVKNVHPYYAIADAFVLSSLAEGFGIVLLEAMAARLPIITTELPGPKEALGKHGLFVPAGNTEALSNRILELCNKSMRRRHSELSRNRVGHFDIREAITAHVDLYRELYHDDSGMG